MPTATGDNHSMGDDSERVIIFDTTLRDGEQAPGFTLNVAAKVTMARALDALGVDVIEAGFPIASPADAEAVRQVSRDVRRPVIAALAPPAGRFVTSRKQRARWGRLNGPARATFTRRRRTFTRELSCG